jgi:hypothetical protein
MRAAALLQTTLSEAGRVDAASCSSNVALGRPITNPRTGLAGRLKAAAQRGPNPDPLLGHQRVQPQKRQRAYAHKIARASQGWDWEAHGKQRGTKKPAKAGQVGRKTLVGGPLAAPRSHLMMAVMRHPQGQRSNGVYDVCVLAVPKSRSNSAEPWPGLTSGPFRWGRP